MTKTENPKVVRCQQVLDSIFAAHPEVKGMAVHVESRDGFVWESAVGSANNDGTLLTVKSPVNIASVTKTYVAAAIMRLIEQGKLELNHSIVGLISDESKKMLESDGYELRQITVAHMLNHTSGIFDFVNTSAYQNLTKTVPHHRWSRSEQIQLAITAGSPVFAPSERFEYSETNYLLLTEIIENLTNEPFHISMRNLLKFEALGLDNTWFLLQETKPDHVGNMAEQTAKSFEVNSLNMDYSFDAFGGGGLASTAGDMALFIKYLFEGRVFDNPKTLDLMLSTFPTKDDVEPSYAMGLAITEVNGHKAFGHGGFWGTQMKYVPDLGLAFGVYVLERDSWPIYNQLIEELSEVIVQ